MLKKIDRVSSVKEAFELQNIGIDIIGISMYDKPFWGDKRVVDKQTASSIRRVLNKSKLACEIGIESALCNISFIEEMKFDYVQISDNDFPSLELRQQLQSKNIGIIYSGLVASYDDDPSWILSRYNDVPDLNAAYYQIDLLGDMEDSWEFFKLESPKYPDGLQINDIIKIGEQFPLIITLDFNVDNIRGIIKSIPSIKGIGMPLGDLCVKNNIHYFDNHLAVNVVHRMKEL